MALSPPRIGVLVTLDSKFDVALSFCRALEKAGGEPLIIDLSLRPHQHTTPEFSIVSPLQRGPVSFEDLSGKSRGDASQLMIDTGIELLSHAFEAEKLSGIIGIGGANGSTISCAIMRALPYLLPKAMVTPVAATAAVQWYVAQSDIAMFPSIGDISLNRITPGYFRERRPCDCRDGCCLSAKIAGRCSDQTADRSVNVW